MNNQQLVTQQWWADPNHDSILIVAESRVLIRFVNRFYLKGDNLLWIWFEFMVIWFVILANHRPESD